MLKCLTMVGEVINGEEAFGYATKPAVIDKVAYRGAPPARSGASSGRREVMERILGSLAAKAGDDSAAQVRSRVRAPVGTGEARIQCENYDRRSELADVGFRQ